MQKWEYKFVNFQVIRNSWTTGDIFETSKLVTTEGLFGGEKQKLKQVPVSDGVVEALCNELGKEGWELAGTLPIISYDLLFGRGSNTSRVYFTFKRQKI